MSGHHEKAPFSDLHSGLDRLEAELIGTDYLEGTSPPYFQERLIPILAALGDVVRAARTAIEPALQEEVARADRRAIYRAQGEA